MQQAFLGDEVVCDLAKNDGGKDSMKGVRGQGHNYDDQPVQKRGARCEGAEAGRDE